MLGKLSYPINSFATHQPVLIEVINKTSGNIIELGCGDGSTKLIKQLIKNTDRKLISLESDREWFNKFAPLADKNHSLFYVDATNDDIATTGEIWVDFIKQNELISGLTFEVCLIDQSPWIARTYCLEYFKNIVKFIILHDVDYFPKNKLWGEIIDRKIRHEKIKLEMIFDDVVTNYKVYYPPFDYFALNTGPPTLLCSNLTTLEEFEALDIDISNYYRAGMIAKLKMIQKVKKKVKDVLRLLNFCL